MRDGRRLQLFVKCQWNPGDALINLFTPNLPPPPPPLTEGKHTDGWYTDGQNWPALHKRTTERRNGRSN